MIVYWYFFVIAGLIPHIIVHYKIYFHKEYLSMLYESINQYTMDDFINSLIDLLISCTTGIMILIIPMGPYLRTSPFLLKHFSIGFITFQALWHIVLKNHPLMQDEIRNRTKWIYKILEKFHNIY